MPQESRPNPRHHPASSFDGEITLITEEPPGGLPLDCAEVIEREKKRQSELTKRFGNDNEPSLNE